MARDVLETTIRPQGFEHFLQAAPGRFYAGRHFIADIIPGRNLNPQQLKRIFAEAARDNGAGIMIDPWVKKTSGSDHLAIGCVLSESHMTGAFRKTTAADGSPVAYFALDIFTCGPVDPELVAQPVIAALEPVVEPRITGLTRGQVRSTAGLIHPIWNLQPGTPRPDGSISEARHILADMWGCKIMVVADVESAMRSAGSAMLKRAAPKPKSYPFEPHGVSSILLNPSFHITQHSWPEADPGFCAFDILAFDGLDPMAAVQKLHDLLQPADGTYYTEVGRSPAQRPVPTGIGPLWYRLERLNLPAWRLTPAPPPAYKTALGEGLGCCDAPAGCRTETRNEGRGLPAAR